MNRKMPLLIIALAALTVGAEACSTGSSTPGSVILGDNLTDDPVPGLDAAQTVSFGNGSVEYCHAFMPSEGLGPLYVRQTCDACHHQNVDGPGFLQKMSVVSDGVASADQATLLPYGPQVKPFACCGAHTPILPPDNPSVETTVRFGLPVLGRGYLDAVSTDGMLAMVRQEELEGYVHGQVNILDNGTIGKFGWKAKEPTLRAFIGQAFLQDIGITSPDFPVEPPNPDGVTDDDLPGVDIPEQTVLDMTIYVAGLELPRRLTTPQGELLFEKVGCSHCHVPVMPVVPNYPIAYISQGGGAPIYSDLLLHHMPMLADGVREGSATEDQFRTAPLIGIRFLTNYLQNGIAHSVPEAISYHEDGEAQFAVTNYLALNSADQAALVDFVEGL